MFLDKLLFFNKCVHKCTDFHMNASSSVEEDACLNNSCREDELCYMDELALSGFNCGTFVAFYSVHPYYVM